MRANVLYDLIIEEVERAFDGVPGTSIVRGAGRVFLRIAPRTLARPILVQFKKLSKELKPRNYPTQGALDFDLQLPVAGIPPDVRLTVGYRLNRLATAILDITALCMNGKAPAWTYEIMSAAAPSVATLPLVGTPAATTSKTKRRTNLRAAKGVVLPFKKRGTPGSGPTST